MSFGEYIVIYLIVGVVCGFVCMGIASSRNMSNGFWWGFWLGIIGIIIVAVRPKDTPSYQTAGSAFTTGSYYDKEKREEEILADNGWRCSCGHVNFKYQSICSACNKNRSKSSEKTQPILSAGNIEEKNNIAKIREFKGLLDEGIITQEEFEAKKKELLEL